MERKLLHARTSFIGKLRQIFKNFGFRFDVVLCKAKAVEPPPLVVFKSIKAGIIYLGIKIIGLRQFKLKVKLVFLGLKVTKLYG